MDHFFTCNAYETEPETNWRDIYIGETARQIEIAEHIEKRLKVRQDIIDKQEDGLASTNPGSTCSILL